MHPVLSCLSRAPRIKSFLWDSVDAPLVYQPDSHPGAPFTGVLWASQLHGKDAGLTFPDTKPSPGPLPQVSIPSRPVGPSLSLHRVLKPQSPRSLVILSAPEIHQAANPLPSRQGRTYAPHHGLQAPHAHLNNLSACSLVHGWYPAGHSHLHSPWSSLPGLECASSPG